MSPETAAKIEELESVAERFSLEFCEINRLLTLQDVPEDDSLLKRVEWFIEKVVTPKQSRPKKKGSSSNGKRGRAPKLSDDDVREIRRAVRDKECTQAALASKYGVSQPYINLIVHRKVRADV